MSLQQTAIKRLSQQSSHSELATRDFFAVLELGLAIVLVHKRNDINGDFFRARRFTFTMVGA